MPRLAGVRTARLRRRGGGRLIHGGELARAYSPILMLRAQEDLDDPCNTTEEQYSPPTRVEAVLGNPRVTLIHHVDGEDVAVERAPMAADMTSS